MSISPPRDEAAIAGRESVYVDANRAAGWGLGINVLLVAAKLAGGIISSSTALIADSVNSIGDVTSSIAVRGALHIAQQDEDDDHPYGHTKAESIAALCVSLLVVCGACVLAFETVSKFSQQPAIPSMTAAIVAGVCCVVKEILYQYTKRVSRRIGSASLRATALDHRSDALASGGIAISLVAAPYLGKFGPYVDPTVALLVCLLLVVMGIRIFFATAGQLMDQQADEATVNHTRAIARSVEQVGNIEKLRVRKSGLEFFVEIHVQVDGELSVNEGHRIGHEVKDRLLAQMPRIRDVHVHIEPYTGVE